MTLCFCVLELVPITYYAQLIRELYAVTEASASGEDQSQKGTQLLEIYALEIQMHNETRNYKKLKVMCFCLHLQGPERHDPRPSGNLQRVEQYPLCDSTPAYHGYH
jgi:hypothetical protein